jgi:hypothetical protein
MSKRLILAGVTLLVSLLATSPSVSRAQTAQPAHITVEWHDASLSDVVNAFAK